MENFNKIISFMLGLVVVVVFLAIISGRINLRKRFPQLFSGARISMTKPTPSPTIVETETTRNNVYQITPTISNINRSNNQVAAPSSIPATGTTTGLLPFLGLSLISGIFILRASKTRNFQNSRTN